MMLCASLACGSLLQAQTVLMQDDFHYKTDDLDGHSPAKGTEQWKVGAVKGVVSTDGSQAVIITGEGKRGQETGSVRASYPFDGAPNTLYTLSVTFKFKPMNESQDCWGGFGFAYPENNITGPWMLIRPQENPESEGGAVAFGGGEGKEDVTAGDMRLASEEMSVPVKAKITWNSSTGEAHYYINNELKMDWAQTTPFPTGQVSAFFQGFQAGDSVKVTNITLTAEPVKSQPVKK